MTDESSKMLGECPECVIVALETVIIGKLHSDRTWYLEAVDKAQQKRFLHDDSIMLR
jgi:hypothetical protein